VVHDVVDEDVAISQPSMLLGGCHLENGDYGGGFVKIESDSERVEEGVGGGGRDVVSIIVVCHITEFMEEINTLDDPGVVVW